jgi:hypothetical protein
VVAVAVNEQDRRNFGRAGAAEGLCAKADNPNPPAAKGRAPAPCNSARRDSRIFTISPLFFRILAPLCDRCKGPKHWTAKDFRRHDFAAQEIKAGPDRRHGTGHD